MIDDATSRLFARFYHSDSTVNNMDLLKRYIKRHGRPVSIYADKASHFRYNGAIDIAHQLSGDTPKMASRNTDYLTQLMRQFQAI